MIRLTDWLTIWLCLRKMASISRPTRRRPFLKFALGWQVLAVGAVEVAVEAVDELAQERAPGERGTEILADAALGLCTDVLDHGLAGLLEFLDSPSAVIEVAECRDVIPAVVEQGGGEAVIDVCDGIPGQVDGESDRAGRRWAVRGRGSGRSPARR